MTFKVQIPQRLLIAFWALCLVMVVAPVLGQDRNDCILDHCADKAPLPHASSDGPEDAGSRASYRPGPRGASVPGDFDFYVLALSWSPGFCGLWPQYQHGYPSDCGPSGRWPSRIALQNTVGLYPDEGLARYEWRKHGTCSGKSPTDYFADVRRAREAITIPPAFTNAHEVRSLAPIEVQRAFLSANPRLRPGMMAVECARGVMEGVRICFSKDLRDFVACPEVSRQYCRAGSMSVPPMR
jgi:ribonuclease T2